MLSQKLDTVGVKKVNKQLSYQDIYSLCEGIIFLQQGDHNFILLEPQRH